MHQQSMDSSDRKQDTVHQSSSSPERTEQHDKATSSDLKLQRALTSGSEDSANDNAESKYADELRHLPQGKQTQVVQQLQRKYGNRATASVMRQIQNVPLTGSTDVQREEKAAEARPWTSPFDNVTATTKAEATTRLAAIELKLLQLSQNFDLQDGAEEITNDIKTVQQLRGELTGDSGPIDVHDNNKLRMVIGLVHTRYEAKVSGMKSRISNGLNNISTGSAPKVSGTKATVAEKLRIAFREDAQEDYISSLKAALEKLKEYAEWAQKMAKAAKAAKAEKFLATFGKNSTKVSEGLGKANQALTVVNAVKTIATDEGFSPGMEGINTFKSGIALINVGMSFSKAVPLFGDLWSSYYQPLTEACIEGAMIIARSEEELARDIALMEWMGKAPRNGFGAPIISSSAKFYNLFPGRQPVLDFMWVIMDGGSPPITPAVISFFVLVADKMNAGEKRKLETESTSTWYNPLTWWNQDTINESHLIAWVSRRKAVIWAMLYGDLKHGSII
jgi:hypothetical protein